MYSQNKASKATAAIDTSVANYNANLDIVQAQQLDADTLQNIRTERQANKTYLSRMDAAYAAAGVLSNTGSALHAQITTAGRMEQQIQQQYLEGQARQQQLYSAAKAGVAYGGAQASADRTQGNIALINGATNIARTTFGAYNSGVFSGGGGGTGSVAGAELF
jgi:hypothetical protein